MHGTHVAEALDDCMKPAGQSTQVVVSTASAVLYLPGLQSRHRAELLDARLPAAHLKHWMAPNTGPVVLSASQSIQDVAAMAFEYLPATHKVQVAAPEACWKDPGMHLMQAAEPDES